jgi:hypothetical protein
VEGNVMANVIRSHTFFGSCIVLVLFAVGCSHSATPAVPSQALSSVHTRPLGSTAEIYVTQGTAHASLLTFLQSDNGDVAPQRTIDGSGAGAASFGGLTVATNGDLYVTGYTSGQAHSLVMAYAASASGPAPPLLTITCGGMDFPGTLAFDNRGHLDPASSSPPYPISILPANASGCVTGNPVIAGNHTRLYNPQGIAANGDGRLYVLSNNDAITEYAPGATGNAPWIRRIHGPHTGLSTNSQSGDALALDAAGNIYAANAGNNQSITVYAKDADKDATPIRKIAGSLTGLEHPSGLAVDAAGDIFVINNINSSITVYAPGANGNVAPIRTIVGPHTQMSGLLVGIALSR